MTEACSKKPNLLNHLWFTFARVILRIMGWRMLGRLPDIPKYIIIATHTSNWDFVYGLLGMAYLSHGFCDMRFRWMGKRELFQGPVGWFLYKTGGFPIDRSAAHNVVDQAVNEFAGHDRVVMIITPEGTRRRGSRWKTGFYHIAQGANVPILCAFIDYGRKILGPGFLVYPSGDIVADMCRIRDFYRGMPARHPQQVAEPWLPGMERCGASGVDYESWLESNLGRLTATPPV